MEDTGAEGHNTQNNKNGITDIARQGIGRATKKTYLFNLTIDDSSFIIISTTGQYERVEITTACRSVEERG